VRGGGTLYGMGRIKFSHSYDEIISIENLFEAWKEFKRGKTKKEGVQRFQLHLMEHILTLHTDLRNKTYRHGHYRNFRIADPKPRDIHKASVRDRLLHHAMYRKLYPFFDRTFISDSFSCRLGKGTHRAMNRFRTFAYKVSKNHTRTCYVLKCDIRKFFANIDHAILFSILSAYIPNEDILHLLTGIVRSFYTSAEVKSSVLADSDTSFTKGGIGLPLGNLTSQLLVNIYMNEFDQFVKHALKAKYYIRYADDFVILSSDRKELEQLLVQIQVFLEKRLKLFLHPDKVSIKTVSSGVDFLGWLHFPDHRVLRTSTRKRMFRRLQGEPSDETVASYLGLLSYGNACMLQKEVKESYS